MLQVQVLRNNTAEVKKKLALKQFKQLELVDQVVSLDDERKKLQADFDQTQAKVNAASKEIGKCMATGNQAEADSIKSNVAAWKALLEPLKDQMAIVEKELLATLVLLPNLPADAVPEGKTPEENVVVREGGLKPALYAGAVPHWDLIKTYDLVDFETGAKITGSGFPLYKGKGAKLQRALIQYFLDYNTDAGYTDCLLYTSPSPRDRTRSRMPSSA